MTEQADDSARAAAWEELIEALAEYPPDSGEVLSALGRVWPDDAGTAMTWSKLHRWESPTWDPPRLTLEIERHGATMGGSTRAEMQTWVVDTESRTVDHVGSGFRLVRPSSPRMHMRPLAEQCVAAMQAGPDGDTTGWLKWVNPNEVRLQIGKVVPTTNQQTTTDRRQRFSKELAEVAEGSGWREVSAHRWVRDAQGGPVA